MKLETPRCPSCHAPIEGFVGTPTVCRYCGSTILVREPPPAKTETRFSLVVRVGPSNVERVGALLADRLGIEPAEARSLLSSLRCELESGADEVAARTLARDIADAGAQVDVVPRAVAIPFVRVLLEEVGDDKLAVVVALRRHLDLGMKETRALVERAPVVVVESMEEPRALALVAALQAAGARARVG